jgi:DNA-binding GntR family transcriptional regulator
MKSKPMALIKKATTTDAELFEDPIPNGKKSICIDDLRRRILTQSLRPGEYLDEVEVGEEYGISRPPVREALRQLSGEGYVVLHEKRGAQVAPMTHTTLRNFFVVAPMIYAAVARLAAENTTPALIDQLKQTQFKFRKAIKAGDAAQRALLNERFHAVMGDMAANEFLLPSLRRLLIDHTRISITFYDPRKSLFAKQQAAAADHHDQFIAHIEAGEADAAADLAVEHWELSRSQLASFVMPDGINAPLGTPPDIQQQGAS